MSTIIEKNTTGNMQIFKYEDGELWLKSYSSDIARIDSLGEVWLFQDFDYSNTTRRHLSHFLEKYANLHLTRKQKLDLRKKTFEKFGY